MSIKYALTAIAMLALPGMAAADPTGSYSLVGRNPDSGEEYTGTVEVSRRGETYIVVWDIGGKESIGTGLGAKFVGEDRFEIGPASDDDTAISVGYVAEDNFGIAMYFEQPDGTWQGVWTYGGSEKVTGEIWTRD
ncbi:MAG: hypothetical protein H5U11_05170 [Rhizobium sp.]|nr:hypothetical protein [Rhizobium sp.]